MANQSTTPRRRRRPEKIVQFLKSKGLDPDTWPLSPHLATNRWYATFESRRYYYGPLDGDPDEALARYNHEAPYLKRGKNPPPRLEDGIRLHEVLNPWLERQEARMGRGKIKASTFSDYRRVADFLVGVVGRETIVATMTPDVWEDVRDAIDDKTSSPTVASRYVVITRQAFRWAVENHVIAQAPAWGSEFIVASKADRRAAQHARGRQTFAADELRTIINDSPPLIRTATMLACNMGMTQIDVSDLRRRDVDLDAGMIDNLRGKTGMVRRAPLWDSTLDLLRPHLKGKRPEDRIFLRDNGKPLLYFTDHATPQPRDGIGRRFAVVMKRNKIELDRASFGHIKHTFKSVVSIVNDPVAVDTVVGHEPGKGIDWHYLRNIERPRLDTVVAAMHAWLFGEGGGGE